MTMLDPLRELKGRSQGFRTKARACHFLIQYYTFMTSTRSPGRVFAFCGTGRGDRGQKVSREMERVHLEANRFALAMNNSAMIQVQYHRRLETVR